MTKDEIKKALRRCSGNSINDCKDCPYANNSEFSCANGEMYKDALNLITEQEKEIERLKDDYAKLQEQFAKYQTASDKEILAQVKQAKIEVLKELIDGYGRYYISHVGLEKYKVWRVLKEIIEEIQNAED